MYVIVLISLVFTRVTSFLPPFASFFFLQRAIKKCDNAKQRAKLKKKFSRVKQPVSPSSSRSCSCLLLMPDEQPMAVKHQTRKTAFTNPHAQSAAAQPCASVLCSISLSLSLSLSRGCHRRLRCAFSVRHSDVRSICRDCWCLLIQVPGVFIKVLRIRKKQTKAERDAARFAAALQVQYGGVMQHYCCVP